MILFPDKYPAVFRRLYPHRLALQKASKTLFLTFDDGPVPEITPWVLNQLEKYGAKATFFCIGDNIKKHPEIFRQVLAEGHQIGNHTYNHLNGWKTSEKEFVQNVCLAEKAIAEERNESQESKKNKQEKRNLIPKTQKFKPKNVNHQPLFRPPFGKIRNSQARELTRRGYKIVMWDVLSWDFRSDITPEQCLKKVLKNAEEGSIIVFHDNQKAAKNLKAALPEVLRYYHEKGFQFKSL